MGKFQGVISPAIADRLPHRHLELVGAAPTAWSGRTGGGPRRPCSRSCRWLPGRRRASRPGPCPSRASCRARTPPCAAPGSRRRGRGSRRAWARAAARQRGKASRAAATARLHVLGAGVGEGADQVARVGGVAVLERACRRRRAPTRRRCSCRAPRPGRRRPRTAGAAPWRSRGGHLARSLASLSLRSSLRPDMSLLPLNIAPSAITILGARMLPVSLPGGLHLHPHHGRAVADDLAAHDDGLGLDRGLTSPALADAHVARDVDLALDAAFDDDVLVAGELALDRGLGADHARS